MADQRNYLPIDTQIQQAKLPYSSLIMVLGIISIIGAFVYGLPGIVSGVTGLVLANKDRALYLSAPEFYLTTDYRRLNKGRVYSILGIVLGLLFVIGMTLNFIFATGEVQPR